MEIGINSFAAFKQYRTGVEEYTYQLIKHLAMLKQAKEHSFSLYTNQVTEEHFFLPDNFKIKQLRWPLPVWTQIRLSSEMILKKPDILFIPVHVLPLIHPKNSIVTVHGLEYEYYPKMYPRKHLRYLRWSTKYALKNARKIITVSENTKRDLIALYGASPKKISVVHNGFEIEIKDRKRENLILFIGRLETRKNVQGLIQSFNLLKEKYRIPHKLVLIGPRGYGYEKIKKELLNSEFKSEIIEKGFIPTEEKEELLARADVFALPSFYEGFGIPILEAQASGCPVITSNVSAMPEVAGEGAILIKPKNINELTEGIYHLITDKEIRNEMIEKGYENVKRFSWDKCAQETLRVLLE